jgi:hypothetical protein
VEPLILQQYAAGADRLLAQRCREVAHQHEIVIHLEGAGRNSKTQESNFENSRRAWHQVADRDRLHRQLGL